MSLNRVISYEVDEEVDENYMDHSDKLYGERALPIRCKLKYEELDTKKAKKQSKRVAPPFGLSPPSESQIMLRRRKEAEACCNLHETESSSSSSCSSPMPASSYFTS